MRTKNDGINRVVFIGGGVLFLILTLGFFLQMSWAAALWPWPISRLASIFIASITAAVGTPMIWIGLSGEFGAARGGATALGIAAAGTAITLFYLYSREQDLQLLVTALLFALFVPLNLLIYFWSRSIPIRDQREKPIMVEFSFVFFIILFILVGWALIRQAPRIFPWPMKPETSLIFGMIFVGAIFYFLAALRMPNWDSARGQLLGILAHDLVLVGPFLAHIREVSAPHSTSLAIYLIVLAYSGFLAIYFLFIDKTTRSWRIQESA